MFSSSLLNIAAGCSSPTVVHNHHHQLLQESDFSDIFSDHNSSISGCLFHSPNPVAGTTINTPSFEKDVMDMDMVPASVAAVSKKKSDKRSKIRTAQGLRDRRVRMSIGIARKFFDLQDLLGFDKPSRTLEWLLKSSNKAILELSGAASSSSTSSKETAADATRTGNDYKISLSSSRSTDEAERLSCNSAPLKTMKQKATSLARESRDKARSRARARTVAKLSTAKLNNQKIQLLSTYPDEKRGDPNSYLSKNEYKFSSPSLVKSLVAENHNEERNNGEEQHKQNQKLQLHTYYSGIKSYYQSDLSPNLSLNQWDISSVFPKPSSSTAHQLNFQRDFDTFGRASWDCLLNNYKTL